VLEVLQRELKKDRSKVYVVEISPLGLVEMTRKNVADGVREIMTCECPVCEGTGRVLSDESLAIDMLRNLRRVARESKSEAFRVELEDGVARALIGPGGSGLDELEHETGRAFDIVGRLDVERDHFEVVAEGTLAEIGAQAPPCVAGDELNLPILEPHRFVETDAVSRLSAGYEVQVVGGLPYVGTQQRMRIERATRFAAQASLLDVEPARPVAPGPPPRIAEDGEVEDKISDILEPERRVGERTDVEGRVRRQKRRTAAEQRRERGGRSGGSGSGGSGGAKSGGGGDSSRSKAADKTADGEAESLVDGDTVEQRATGDGDTAAKKRRRRGGRGRRGRGGSGGARAAENGAGENGAAEGVANGAAEPAAAGAGASERPARAPGAARPRQRRRRSGSAGGGGGANGSADAGRAEREPAAAAAPAATTPPRPAHSEPASRDAPTASEDERRKGLISRILGR
jgi:ribonuclease G